jgi:hypothetical protein
VANSPEHSGERGLPQVALATYDCGHRNHVVSVGGMAHAKKKSYRDYG